MATIEDRMAKAFGLEGDVWERHAHPWSVYTRIPIPALLAAAIWSRKWIGWRSLVPVGGVCVWTVINPKAFPRPLSFDRWASKAVLGERVWANRKETPVPERHRAAPHVLTGINALGVPFVARGLVVLDPWLVLFGLAVHMAGKNWFMDRMALLYDDVTAGPPDTGATGGADSPPTPRTTVRRSARSTDPQAGADHRRRRDDY